MTRTTTRTLPWIAAVALALGATMAQAQTPAQPAPAKTEKSAKHHGDKHANRAERHAQRLAELEQKLNLTPAQQGAWAQYKAAMQPPAGSARPADAQGQAASAEAKEQRRAEKSARKQARAEATQAFYAQLSPEQQKVFDAEKRHGKRGGHDKKHRGERGQKAS